MDAGAGGCGGGCECADGGEVAGAVAAEGERGLLDRSSRPRRQPRRTPPDRVEAVVRLRRLRMTAAEIAEVLEDGALDGVADPEARRSREAFAAGAARAGQPLRTRAARRARPPRRQEARALRSPGHRLLGRGRGRFETGAGYEYVTSASTTTAASPMSSCSPTSAAQPPPRFLAPRNGPLRSPRRHDRARPHRQRQRLPLSRASATRCNSCRSNTHAHGHGGHRPTAKPSASSKRSSANGPTHASTQQRRTRLNTPDLDSTTTTTDRRHGSLSHQPPAARD